ncbi:MAG: type IV secretion system DNA-binding domain-containing protein [Candidatus Magasanikbacteria bacterium]
MIEEGQNLLASSKPLVRVDSEINYFGMTNYRNQNRRFGIKLDDRRRHMYVVGKTGMGKTTMLENMVLNDIYAGHGVGVVDPHGDFAEKIIDFIPPHRINDVVYFNPADMDYPIGFNILETIRPEQKHLVVSGLMGVFKKIWPDVWSARMEYILNNTILALLDFPGTTLLGINRLLADAEYRSRVVANLKDPVVKAFWNTEFAGYNDRYKQEAVAPIQNKIGQFLSASVIRNIVAQVKSRINIREIMDTKKIFIMNLSKGRIGEDNSRLLGGMLITKIQLSAMERVDTPEKDRSDFFLYVDEFQNFATESFANILSEARKYRLSLIMAHQYMEQLSEEVLAAVIGNVGTIVSFRVGSTDSEILAKEFMPTFIETDIVNLAKYQIFLKLMIDGIASQPFSAMTLPPIFSQSLQTTDKVVKVSRERYAISREKIEDKIARWSGMEIGDDGEEIDDEMEKGSPPAVTRPAPVKFSVAKQPAPRFNSAPKPINQPASKYIPRPAVRQQPIPNSPVSVRPTNNVGRNPQSSKPKEELSVRATEPIVLVDASQKGLSLAEAFKPKEPAMKKQHKPQNPSAPTSPVLQQHQKQNVIPSERLPASGGMNPFSSSSQPQSVILSEAKNPSQQSPQPQSPSPKPPTVLKPDEVKKIEKDDEDDAWRHDK